MKSRKQLEKDLENLKYRFKSLSDIPNRREMSKGEEEELELLEIRINDLKQVLKEKVTIRQNQFASIGKTITLLAAVLFLILTIYSTTSAYQFISAGVSVEKQVIMAVTTLLTFALTVGAAYAFSRQSKLEWR